jgi:hypothetical protein
MRSIHDTLKSADECGRAAHVQRTDGQREFYNHLEHHLLGIAAMKQWLLETEKSRVEVPSS